MGRIQNYQLGKNIKNHEESKWIFDTRSINLSKDLKKYGFNMWVIGG